MEFIKAADKLKKFEPAKFKEKSLPFLADESDYEDYHTKLRNGTFKEFPGFGIKSLDVYLRLKDGDLYMANGVDNVGKSTVLWYLLILSSLLYGWRHVIFTSENSVGGFTRKMVEFYWCKPIAEQTNSEYAEAKAFINHHFSIIRATETLYTMRELMGMVDEVVSVKGFHKGFLIDPVNSLKLGLKQGSKNSTHEERYEVLTELKIWARNRGITTFVNNHVITEATRRVDPDGHVVAPFKADTEGGGQSANKGDQFITIHRKTSHPTDWMITEIHVRKNKENESGGKVTRMNEPVLLRMLPNGCGFEEQDEIGRARNPVLAFRKYGIEQEPSPIEKFSPLPQSEFDL